MNTKELVAELLAESPVEDRCPNLRVDIVGAYCGRDLQPGEEVLQGRRSICDHMSLQLWCLDKERYNLCIWNRDEPIR